MKRLVLALTLLTISACAKQPPQAIPMPADAAIRAAQPARAIPAPPQFMAALTSGPTQETYPLRIHGNPQKLVYMDRKEIVCVDPQAHWVPGNPVIPIPAGEPVVTTHVAHIQLCGPYMAEFNQPFRIDFTVKTFHLNGQIADFFPGILQGRAARDVVWDTPNGQQPVMMGDPHGLKTWTGHFTVDPDPAYKHGWVSITASSAVLLSNGDSTRANSHFPVFSVLDQTQPEEYGFPMVASRRRGSPGW